MRRITLPVAFLLWICVALIGPASAQAELILSAETVTTSAGSSGFVQILLRNNFATPQSISGFAVDLALSGSGVQFVGVDNQTNPAYIFGALGTGDLTFDSFPNLGFIASDVSLNTDGFVTLAPGQSAGLGRISFAVASMAASGLRPITFARGPTTLFTNAAGDPYADTSVSFVSGGINVQGATVVLPEPSSALLFVVGAIGGMFAMKVRTRRA